MTIWAVVPVKPLERAKSRLAAVLSAKERVSLSEAMLIHTLKVLAESPDLERTLVVSRDPRVLSLARAHGARTVAEQGRPHLNRALVRAAHVARGYGVSAILVLPADLPLLTGEDLARLLSYAQRPPVVVLAPDRRGTGTNALLCSPAGLIEYEFGPDSFARHRARAEAAGVAVEICRLPSLELDLDLPEDLELIRLAGNGALTGVQAGGRSL